MEGPKVQMIGEPCGQHGPYTFYKAFKYLRDGQYTILSLGQFFFLKILNSIPICIAELQLVWKDKTSSQELASVRIYFRPEDTPEGRQPIHGQDEILALSDKLVLKLEDLVTLVSRDVEMKAGRKAMTDAELKPVPEMSPDLAKSFTVNTFGLDFKDIDKEREIIGDKQDTTSTEVHILSYSRYCRYRCVLKRLENCTDRWLKHALVCAIGGFTARTPDNVVFFCRAMCDYPDLDDFDLRCDHLAPNLKGRPRKRKGLKRENSEESESSSESSSTPTKPDIKIRFGKRATPLRNGFKLDREKVSKDEQAFLIDLHKYMKSRSTPIGRIPSLGFKQIDLYHFYTMARKIGGYEQITAKRMWKYLYDQLGGNPGSTSAATCTRRHYEKLLLPYERHMKGDNSGKPVIKKKPHVSMALAALKRAKESKHGPKPEVGVIREVKVAEPEVKVSEEEKVNGRVPVPEEEGASLTDKEQKALIIKKEIQKMKIRKNAQRLLEREKIWDERRKQKLLDKVRKPSGGQKTVRELLDQNYKLEDQVGDMKPDIAGLSFENGSSPNGIDRKPASNSVHQKQGIIAEMKTEVKQEPAATKGISVPQTESQSPVHQGLPALGIPHPMFFPPQLIPMGSSQIRGVAPLGVPVMIPQFGMPLPLQPVTSTDTSTSVKDAKPLHALNKLVSEQIQDTGHRNLDSRYSNIHSSVNPALQQRIGAGTQSLLPKAPPPSNPIQAPVRGSPSPISTMSASHPIVPAHSYSVKRPYPPQDSPTGRSVPSYRLPPVLSAHQGLSASHQASETKRQHLISPGELPGHKSASPGPLKGTEDVPVLDLSMKTMRAQEAKHNKENKGMPNYEEKTFDCPQDLSLKAQASPCDLSRKTTPSLNEGHHRNVPLNVPSLHQQPVPPSSVQTGPSRSDGLDLPKNLVKDYSKEMDTSAKTPPFSVSCLPLNIGGAFVHPAFPSPFMMPPGMFPTPLQLQQMIQGQVSPGLPVVHPELVPSSALFPSTSSVPSSYRGSNSYTQSKR